MADLTYLWALELAAGLIIGVGAIFLQIFLSKKENRILGLILPGLTFLYFFITFLKVLIFWGEMFLIPTIMLFYFINVITAVFLAIYFSCRRTVEKNKSLEKMILLDLN